MSNIPAGATHKAETYGVTHYYRRVQWEHLNQVSEEWITLVRWDWWDKGQWQDQTGKGFSPRRCEEI